jgi:hypothetical protein
MLYRHSLDELAAGFRQLELARLDPYFFALPPQIIQAGVLPPVLRARSTLARRSASLIPLE